MINLAIQGNPPAYTTEEIARVTVQREPPESDEAEATCIALFNEVSLAHPDQVKRVFSHDECDIDANFLGFMETYKALATLIGKDRVIYDLGCAYGFQAWYFREHRGYVGVDVCPLDARIQLPGHVHHQMTIEKFVRTMPIDAKHFAICNFVPSWFGHQTRHVRERFEQCYVYYPCMLEPKAGSSDGGIPS